MCGIAEGSTPFARFLFEVHRARYTSRRLLPDLVHYRWEPEKGRLLPYLGGLFVYTTGWTILILTAATRVLIRRDLP